MLQTFRSRLPLVLWLAFATAMCGCSPGREPPAIVKGQVVNKGRPVTAAVVYFEREGDDYSIFASLDDAGQFQMKTHDYGGLPEGAYKIAIKPDPGKGTFLAGDNKVFSHPLIPPQFMKAETSGLRVEVKKGENEPFVWDLGKN